MINPYQSPTAIQDKVTSTHASNPPAWMMGRYWLYITFLCTIASVCAIIILSFANVSPWWRDKLACLACILIGGTCVLHSFRLAWCPRTVIVTQAICLSAWTIIARLARSWLGLPDSLGIFAIFIWFELCCASCAACALAMLLASTYMRLGQ